jgi:predicted small lipoprotein YifL
MKLKNLFALNVLAATLAACGGGDIELKPSNSVTDSNNNTTNNNGGGASSSSVAANPCASYELGGQAVQGVLNGNNCTYGVTFVSDTRPLTTDLVIPALPNGGVHVFQDSLFIGEDVDANDAAAGTAVPAAGAGPILTIAAGAKLAFSNPVDYVRIARGSQIFAEGTKEAPIVFSATKDLIENAATESDRGLWGGVQILGQGLTNKCTDPTNCHITTEGRPGTYGGNNNEESSGVLKYVVVKHAGYEVVDGNELNGITFYTVGSGTTVEYVQTYSTRDDGFEMFGGAVNLKHVVAVNIADDSYDFADGYVGNIQFAVTINPSGGGRCIEGDNTGGSRADDLTPMTHPRIANMTCVTSGVDKNMGTIPSPKDDSEGPLFREGTQFELYNTIITSNATGMASNECFEVDDTEGPTTVDGIEAGISVAKSNLVACSESIKTGTLDPSNSTFSAKTWFTATGTNNVVIDAAVTGGLPANIIKDLATNPRAYLTLAAMTDGNSSAISVPVTNVTTLSEAPSTTTAPVAGSNDFFEAVDFIGAVSEANDWVSGWTVGLTAN